VGEQDNPETLELRQIAEGGRLRQHVLRQIDTMRKSPPIDTVDLKEELVTAGAHWWDLGGGPPVT
jgi:hypothetical protein